MVDNVGKRFSWWKKHGYCVHGPKARNLAENQVFPSLSTKDLRCDDDFVKEFFENKAQKDSPLWFMYTLVWVGGEIPDTYEKSFLKT